MRRCLAPAQACSLQPAATCFYSAAWPSALPTDHNTSAGVRNISNCLSIRTAFDRCSEGLREHARSQGYWDGSDDFDWAAAFSDGGAPPLGQLTPGREAEGHRWGGLRTWGPASAWQQVSMAWVFASELACLCGGNAPAEPRTGVASLLPQCPSTASGAWTATRLLHPFLLHCHLTGCSRQQPASWDLLR